MTNLKTLLFGIPGQPLVEIDGRLLAAIAVGVGLAVATMEKQINPEFTVDEWNAINASQDLLCSGKFDDEKWMIDARSVIRKLHTIACCQ